MEPGSKPKQLLPDGGAIEGGEPDEDEKRKFTVRFDDRTEQHKFEVAWPNQAAQKAARKLIDPNGITDPIEAEEENTVRIYLREIGTPTLHVYDCYTWVHDDACPECKSRRVYHRKTKTPSYRCSSCEAEFDEPLDIDDVDPKDDLPDHLDEAGEMTYAHVDSRGKSRVPPDEIQLPKE